MRLDIFATKKFLGLGDTVLHNRGRLLRNYVTDGAWPNRDLTYSEAVGLLAKYNRQAQFSDFVLNTLYEALTPEHWIGLTETQLKRIADVFYEFGYSWIASSWDKRWEHARDRLLYGQKIQGGLSSTYPIGLDQSEVDRIRAIFKKGFYGYSPDVPFLMPPEAQIYRPEVEPTPLPLPEPTPAAQAVIEKQDQEWQEYETQIEIGPEGEAVVYSEEVQEPLFAEPVAKAELLEETLSPIVDKAKEILSTTEGKLLAGLGILLFVKGLR